MQLTKNRSEARYASIHRPEKKVNWPKDDRNNFKRISEFYGENIFDIEKQDSIPIDIKREMKEAIKNRRPVKRENIEFVAKIVKDWAVKKGATHFCHWFQPLTGGTAEKHDSFLSFDKDGLPIEQLSVGQLMKGEPDASSFPNGGTRSTFEARGYTTWDLTSPIFLKESCNSKILCIPTGFASYYGEALDVKTPLLRSVSRLNDIMVKFLHLIGNTDVSSVVSTCGAEQEYFLVDKSFYYLRPDLVMAGRTLFGKLTAKNQQLSDHYFGTVQERVLSFMQDLDLALYKVGIPAKTRHNEVAPGQFEIAPIFKDSNLASDQNQLVMALIREVAVKHDFVALLHEKPFSSINGSGKHLNWALSTDKGENLFDPGEHPHTNYRFLTLAAMVVETVYKHGRLLRMSTAGHCNDRRLGGHEAPPCIISVYLGETLNNIFDHIKDGRVFSPSEIKDLDLGAEQLVHFLKDNSDRNRTSPFAFTGNRFEFRAVGSSQAIGFPLSILNAAFCEVVDRYNKYLEDGLKNGKKVDDLLTEVIAKSMHSSSSVIFNGDGYSDEWVQEAERRKLPNLKNTFDALQVLKDRNATKFLSDLKVFKEQEISSRYIILIENYVKHMEIEFSTMIMMVNQYIVPATIDYRNKLLDSILMQKELGINPQIENDLFKKISDATNDVINNSKALDAMVDKISLKNVEESAAKIVSEILPLFNSLVKGCNTLEGIVPDENWGLPKYFDLLFVR